MSIPLVVAVTGHRDLLPAEVPHLRELVKAFLVRLRDAYPDRQVSIICGLAEGADRLVADEAVALQLPLTVALPMPKHLYLQDFATEESRAEFARLCSAAVDVFALPISPGNTESSIAEPGPNRSRQYAQLGVFLCAHCHVLLALGTASHPTSWVALPRSSGFITTTSCRATRRDRSPAAWY